MYSPFRAWMAVSCVVVVCGGGIMCVLCCAAVVSCVRCHAAVRGQEIDAARSVLSNLAARSTEVLQREREEEREREGGGEKEGERRGSQERREGRERINGHSNRHRRRQIRNAVYTFMYTHFHGDCTQGAKEPLPQVLCTPRGMATRARRHRPGCQQEQRGARLLL
jgi:hypothetical protein